ncbi:DMT family transporter [uncultured Jatrophihabitans sp.]|uniref:EamA family transporter n=1 Tax=uncultured Jatrophihabitans sp. TaxID=1610747 RepID=UPI0035CC5DEB
MTSSPTTPAPALGTALAVTSVASVQFGAALAAHLFSRVGPVGTVSLRLVGAAVVLCLLARPWRRHWSGGDARSAMLFGGVFTCMNVTLYLALDRLPLATVITLEFLGPLTVAIVTAGSWATRVWAVPAAAGVLLIGGELSGGDTAGVAFALAAACCWAAYVLLSGRMGRSGSGLAGLATGCVFGALIMLPVGLLSAGVGDLTRPSTAAIGLAVGVLSSAIPYSLDLLALRRLATAVFGVLTSLNPGVGAIAGYLVLGQSLPAATLIGVGLVMVASVGVTVAPLLRARNRIIAPVPSHGELIVDVGTVGNVGSG